MSIIRIHSLSDPGVDIFSVLTEAQLRNRLEPEKGIFIAESPKVIQVALDKGYEALALLCEERHITGDAADIIRRCGDMPVYTGERGMLGALTGYNLTRGVLCAMRRPEATPSLAEKVGERARMDDASAERNGNHKAARQKRGRQSSDVRVGARIFRFFSGAEGRRFLRYGSGARRGRHKAVLRRHTASAPE